MSAESQYVTEKECLEKHRLVTGWMKWAAGLAIAILSLTVGGTVGMSYGALDKAAEAQTNVVEIRATVQMNEEKIDNLTKMMSEVRQTQEENRKTLQIVTSNGEMIKRLLEQHAETKP